ncbi:MAG TPA: transglycosylase SLT domain-containing protein [Polyangiaceae bacterium]|nr:transglycosylase SLT domain-containing protein [Polyangiaceae bacterium]
MGGEAAAALPEVSEIAPTLPAQPWREAAGTEDWRRLARVIDRLPEPEQRQPGTRYARAVAALQLGDAEGALRRLQGLESELPELGEQIAASRAAAQLEVGPFEVAARYYARRSSPADWLSSARAWRKARQWSPALHELNRVLGARHAGRATVRNARELRATISERLGLLETARKDWRWLAMDQVSPGADAAYERLAGARLSKSERLQRACTLAQRGHPSEVLDELERMKRAPGTSPPDAALRSCVARAHYAARDYDRAAPLLERSARAAGSADSGDWFLAAEAWFRARQPEHAARLYRTLAQRYPKSRAAERAMYSLARLRYRQGAWQEAERAYTRYLGRYGARRGRQRARYKDASRYERAVSRLAAGRLQVARRDFEQLRRSSSTSCSSSLLRHLGAVAALESHSAPLRAQAVSELEQVVRSAPLSFAALSSTARLKALGRSAPHWPSLPTATEWSEPPLQLPAAAELLAELGLYSAAETALYSRQANLSSLYAPRSGEALCRQYQLLDRGFRRYAWARSVLRAGILLRPPRADSVWAWQCLHPRPFSSAVVRLESRYELPSGLLYSVMRAESAFRPDARSPAGALGLMQLIPSTAARVAAELDLSDDSQQLWQPLHNLRLGAHYLHRLLTSFDRRVPLALASYNAGPRAVERWLAGAEGLPLDLWVARIPFRETRNYVQTVLASWARYRYLARRPLPQLQLELPTGLQVPSTLY